MRSNAIAAIGLAAVLVLAGCSAGGIGGADDGTGSVTFYVSDQPGAIEDFEHLNATITEVAVKPATTETDGNDTEDNESDWQRYDVEERTVDLTALRGDNATSLDTYDLPAGEYEAVSLTVSEVEGTLTSGESADVKLPSDTLKLQTPFTVESGESLEYVFDVMVVEGGQSGMYALRPVISESGTDVPIREVGPSGQPMDRRGGGGQNADTPTAAGGDGAADAPPAQMDFYVSDQQNAIGDFEHLNVTITEIGLKRAGGGEDAAEDRDTNESDDSAGNETDADDADGDSGWETYAIDNATVDLTTLQGANATRIADFATRSGNYTMVYVEVSDVEGTLTDGNETTVKLPSERLRLNKPFRLAPNASVDFVYDITVRKAGGSGKYVLQPVVGESGPGVEIREVDRQGRPVEDHGNRSDAPADGDDRSD